MILGNRFEFIGYTQSESKRKKIYRFIGLGETRRRGIWSFSSIHTVTLGACIIVDSIEDAEKYKYHAPDRPETYNYCHDCKEWVATQCDFTNQQNDPICESCRDEYFTCTQCYSLLTSSQFTSHHDDILCQSCLDNCDCDECMDSRDGDDDDDDDSPFLNYHSSYKKTLNSNYFSNYSDATKSAWSIPFGFELEFNFDSDANDDVISVTNRSGLPHVWMKDGSLSDGAELISKPIDREYLKKTNLKSLLKSLHRIGCRSYESGECGIHIHVNKTLLINTYGNQERLDLAIFQFLKQYADFLKAFSKRSDDSLNRYAQLPSRTDNTRWLKGERYRAINTCPSETIEFRLYRGTTDYNRTYASILLSLAIHDYLLYLGTNSTSNISLGRFLSSCLEYQFLTDYIIKQDLFKNIFQSRSVAQRKELASLRLAERIALKRKQDAREWEMDFETTKIDLRETVENCNCQMCTENRLHNRQTYEQFENHPPTGILNF